MARISANKLAEFLVTANPVRRRRIIYDQKYPNGPAVPLYRHAQAPIADYFRSGRNPAVLLEAAERLRSDKEGSEWALDDRWNTADALERFEEIAVGLPGDHGEIYSRGDAQPPKLSISDVEVSVRPDFLIQFEKRRVLHTGAVKLHFIKNPDHALTRAGSEYVATLLYEWLKEHGPEGVPSHAHCISIDVFRGATFSAPKSNVRRMQEISVVCEEIASRWPQL